MTFSLIGQPFAVEALLDTFSNPATPVNTTWNYDFNPSGQHVLTYSFSQNASSQLRDIYTQAFLELSRYTGLVFVQIADEPQLLTVGPNFPRQQGADTSADIRISQQTDGLRTGGYGGAYFFSTDSDLDIEDIDAVNQIWSVNYYTILHELGHALTLKHTSSTQDPDNPPYLPASFQNNNYTVMHYFLESPANNTDPATGEWDYRHFQLFDVYALQLRFGFNSSTNSGDTTHNTANLAIDQWLQVLWDSSGIDTIDMSNQSRNQRINLLEGGFSNLGSVAGNNPSGVNLVIGYGAVIENALGGIGNDTIYGNAAANVISGGDGNDILIGYDGNDVLNGGAGANVIVAGAGDDTVTVSAGFNEIYGGVGNDVFNVVSRTDTIVEYVNEGIDEIRTAGDFYDLSASVNVENLTFTDGTSHAALGNALGNVIAGGTGSDTLSALGGNDRLIGGSGAANTLVGGAGDDVFVVSVRGDSIIEYVNEGIDTVETTTSVFYLRDNVENLTFTGIGNFSGIGFSNNNTLTGGTGSDFLSGLDGDDILIGRSGADELLGGVGADQFRYLGGESGYDRIYDFAPGVDRIGLSSAGFARTSTIAFVSNGAPLANSTNSTFLYNTNTGILSYDADGSGGGSAVQLAQLNTGLTLTVSDFIFF
jgi:serralysin